MIWFEYKYLSANDILNNMKLLSSYSIIEYAILVWLIIFTLILIYYILPIIFIYLKEKDKQIEKDKKARMLKQILIQNKINEEIQKEINHH